MRNDNFLLVFKFESAEIFKVWLTMSCALRFQNSNISFFHGNLYSLKLQDSLKNLQILHSHKDLSCWNHKIQWTISEHHWFRNYISTCCTKLCLFSLCSCLCQNVTLISSFAPYRQSTVSFLERFSNKKWEICALFTLPYKTSLKFIEFGLTKCEH